MNTAVSSMSELKKHQSQFPENQILAISQVRVTDLTPETTAVAFFGNDSVEREDLQQWFANEEWREELLFINPFKYCQELKIFGVRRRVFETLEKFGVPLHVRSVGRAITPLFDENGSYREAELDWTYIATSDSISKRIAEAFTSGVYRYLADVFSNSETVALESLRQELQYAAKQVSDGRAFKCLHNMLQKSLADEELELTLYLMAEFFTQEQINTWKNSFIHERQLNSHSRYVKIASGVL